MDNHQVITLQQALNCNYLTALNDRVLFFDGDTVISPSKVTDFLAYTANGQICVTDIVPEIEVYNQVADCPIVEKTEFNQFDLSWKLPQEWVDLDVNQYVFDCFERQVTIEPHTFSDRETLDKYINRVEEELDTYRDLNLYPLLRAVIYTIHMLRSNQIVWGVGRGSSVSSYVLYLVGVHDVDSVFFELDYTDFLR
jgi:DNA polymerase III alpha subunit